MNRGTGNIYIKKSLFPSLGVAPIFRGNALTKGDVRGQNELTHTQLTPIK